MSKSEAVMSRYSSTPPEVLQDLSARGMGMPQAPGRAIADALNATVEMAFNCRRVASAFEV